MGDFDLDLPGLDDDGPKRTPASRFKPKEVQPMQSNIYTSPSDNPWNAFVSEETRTPEIGRGRTGLFSSDLDKPQASKSRTVGGPGLGSGFNYSKPLDVSPRQDEFAMLMKGAGQEVGFETQADLDMERQAREDIERRKREDAGLAYEVEDMLDEMDPGPRPRTSDAPSANEAKRSGDSTPSRAVPNMKFESEIGTLETVASRRRPRTVGVVKSTSGFDSRPNSAPQDTTKTLLKAKTASLESRDSPPNRPSITKVLKDGEIYQIPEEDPRSEDSSRPTDLNDRDTASRGRTVEFAEPIRGVNPEDNKADINRRIMQAVNEERERLKSEHMRDVETRENKYREQLEAQKRLFESQIASLEAVIKHQESLGALSTAISASADTLNSLSAKFQNEKSFDDQLKLQEFSSKQKALSQLEQRLLSQQQVMELDKQHMLEVIKHMQEEDLVKNSVIEQEREGLHKDREELHRFQEFLREQERGRKEEYLKEKQTIGMMRESMQREHSTKMQELAEQTSDLKIKQSLFDQQKAEFEQSDLANRSVLQQKFTQLETVRSQVSEMESRTARKLMEAEEKERAANIEWEKVQRSMSALQSDKSQLEEEAQKLHQVSLAVQAKSLEIAQMREDLDREREDVIRYKQEADMRMSAAKSEANRVEAQHRELTTSMKSYEQLRYGLVRELHTENSSLRNTTSPIQEIQQRLNDLSQLKRAQTPILRKPTFTASEFMKDLQNYDRARGDYQSYMTAESQQLLKTKLEMETGFSESLAASNPGNGLRWKGSASGSERSLKDLTGSALSG